MNAFLSANNGEPRELTETCAFEREQWRAARVSERVLVFGPPSSSAIPR